MCKLKYLKKLKFFSISIFSNLFTSIILHLLFYKISIYYFHSIIYAWKNTYIVLAKKIMPFVTRSFTRIDVYIIYIYLDRKKNDISTLHGFHVPRMVSALAKGFEDFSFGSHLEYRSRCREYRLKQRAILVLSLLKRTYFSLNRVRAKKNC